MVAPTQPDLDELSRRAQAGDTRAAATVLSHHLPYWMSAARDIISSDSRTRTTGGALQDPADLVQDATLKLLTMWSEGTGPEVNARSYVTAIMRNAYANRLRSPRSNERSLADVPAIAIPAVADEVRTAELFREATSVRSAFQKLAPDHQAVLNAVVIDGRKPSQLTEELQRPAAAISNLLQRAKQALFRGVLINHLSEGKDECAANALLLPATVHVDIETHGRDERGLHHVSVCRGCQRNWRRFAAISTAFGVVPLFTIARLAHSTVPAVAVSAEGALDCSATIDDLAVTSGSSAPDPKQRVSRPRTRALASVLASPRTLVAGVSVVVLAALVLIASAVLPVERSTMTTLWSGNTPDSNPYGAQLTTEISETDTSHTRTVELAVTPGDATQLSIDSVTLRFETGTTLKGADERLRCQHQRDSIFCVPLNPGSVATPMTFELSSTEGSGGFTIGVFGTINENPYQGTASALW